MGAEAENDTLPASHGLNDLIAGNGFFAGVSVSGRVLLVDEGDGFWMYGVNPGGIAAGGATPGEAQSEFRKVYTSVLFDIAAEAGDFQELKAQVERSGGCGMAKRKAESEIGVEVVLLEHAVPSVNALDEAELAA